MRNVVLLFLVSFQSVAFAAATSSSTTFETPVVQFKIGADGRVAGLVDRQSGVDYADHAKPVPFATMHATGASYSATAAVQTGDILRLSFGTGRTAEMKITSHPQWFVIEVLKVETGAGGATGSTGLTEPGSDKTAPGADKTARDSDKTSLDIIDLPLTLKGIASESMAACVLALNLKTNVNALPQATGRLQATCYGKFGMVGAKAAVIVCPQAQLRDVMKQVVTAADELPHSPIGGPWALDAPANRGSYILDCTGNTGEQQIDEWIKMLRAMGISQIDFHCGRCLRFGDLVPHPQVHPRGLPGVKAMTDKLHAANMLAGLHTYAFFIAKDASFVTPVPDRGLASDATYTLGEAIDAAAKGLAVNESTASASTTTGFFIQNSITLRVDDELIIYHGVRKEAPFGFDSCERGAYGTKAAAHAAGAKLLHLKECFGLFVPEPDSTLWKQVIARTAQVYNEGGFDMIYLDALDGEGILGGGEWGWYYGSKFVFELAGQLNKPALFEMSTFHHHLWFVRSRMGAWDAPSRGARPFIEIHRMANESCRDMFLPPHLGWWAMHAWQGIQPERTFPETIEYLCARCIADGCGLLFLATAAPAEFSKKNLRFGGIISKYEELRRTGLVSPEMRKKLGVPFDEYTLDTSLSEPGAVSPVKPRFRPVQFDKHKIGRVEAKGDTWSIQNRFGRQPLAVRIEAMMSAVDYDSPEATVVEDFAKSDAFSARQVPPGTTASIEKLANGGARLAVTGRPATNPPWTMIGRKFSPFLNVKDKALGFWVEGDGKGELINVQLKSPLSAYGGVSDRYAKIDFTGKHYVELIEPESDDIPEHEWPYMPRRADWATKRGAGMGGAYPCFHFWVSYDQIEELNLWYNDLPAGDVSCTISSIKALPLKPCKMKNPAITLAGKTFTFPTELQTGQYIECRSAGDCKLYDAEGNVTGDLKPQGDWPDLQAGSNNLQFTTESLPGPHARATITVITRGDPL